MSTPKEIKVRRDLEISKLNLILSKLLPFNKEYEEYSYKQVRGEVDLDLPTPCSNEHVASTYFSIIVYALLLEEKFPEQFKVSGKEVLKYCDIPYVNTREEIMELLFELYDSSHKLRFAVETMSSIEEVRQYTSENGWLKIKLDTVKHESHEQ